LLLALAMIMFTAVIFDMDGVIIDSEPFWKEADIKVYGDLGIELTEEMCAQTTGLDGFKAVEYWYNYKPWPDRSFKEVKNDIETRVVECVKERGKPAAGLDYILNFIESRKMKIGLASASPMHIIEAVLEKLGVKNRFNISHSAELEKQGKPHPDVYLGTARMLNIRPSECIVVEDSIYGLQSAKAAGMKVVAIPDRHLKDDDRFKSADVIISSLFDFNEEILNKLAKS
jgi:mannitol-1-/sugar-/sorbitol-6-/2-deoxyglucose-6-phosphatase